MPHWTCLLRLLWRISGLMTATTKPGDHRESWVPFYARGLCRGKVNASTGSDRGFPHPSAAPTQAGIAVGGDHRGDDAALASKRQKRRWWTGFARGCVLICTIGGADADQGLRFASDGSVCGRERGGPCVHWPSPRCQGADSRPFQHRPSLCSPGKVGNRRGQPLGESSKPMAWVLSTRGVCRPIPRHRSYPLAIPTNPAFCGVWHNVVAAP